MVRRDLTHAFWKKRPDFVASNENLILHQDTAQCHTIRNTLLEIDVLGFQQAIRQPYSMDLAPLDVFFLIWQESIYISPGLSIQSLFTYICVLSLYL